MAYPTGSGSEILRRGAINSQAAVATAFKFDGTDPSTGTSSYTVPANHIITMLSIIITEYANAVKEFTLYINNGHGSLPQINFIQDRSVGARQTFIFADKFVLIGGDNLKVNANSGSVFDILYTYVDQNWE